MSTHSKTLRRIPSEQKRELKVNTARIHRRREKVSVKKALETPAPDETLNLDEYKRAHDPWNYD